MANALLVHDLLGLHHRRLQPAGVDLARHEVADVPVGKPRAIFGEGADDVALGDDPDEHPFRVADREGANVEVAEPGADGGDRTPPEYRSEESAGSIAGRPTLAWAKSLPWRHLLPLVGVPVNLPGELAGMKAAGGAGPTASRS